MLYNYNMDANNGEHQIEIEDPPVIHKVTVTKIMGGSAYTVNDENFTEANPKGRFKKVGTKGEADKLRQKWQKEHGPISDNGERENGDSKSARIRELVDSFTPFKQIATEVGCRYQMAYNIGMKYLKKKGPASVNEYERKAMKGGEPGIIE